MKIVISFLLIFNSLFTQLIAQCNFKVDAGKDMLVCRPGDMVTLNGKITGNPKEFFWEPTINLSGPKSLTPKVTVFGPMTYYLVAKGLDPTNLVINGTFSSGRTGYTTDYAVGSTPCYGFGYLDCEGTYDVITNPQLGHSAWGSCGDHTSGGGLMMVLNGAASLQNVWCQQVPVMPDMDYEFSFWCASVSPASPAILQVSVNGSTVGPIFNSSGAVCAWEKFFASFNSGGNTSIEICIVNQNTATGGNDFAIDDIVLNKICEIRDTVEVDVQEIIAEIEDPEIITCDKYIIQLNGNGSSKGPGWTYQWTASPGKILSGDKTLQPTIDGPGTYNLTVCSPLPNCCKTVTVEVMGNKTPPVINLSTKDTIGCGKNFALIKTTTSDQDVTYDWNGPNGYNADVKDPLVFESGTYYVTVTDAYNCKRIDSIKIIGRADNPKIVMNANSINCKTDSSFLNVNSSIPNSMFEWSGPKGKTKTGPNWTTADSGLYYVKTTTPSGCIRFDSVYVAVDKNKPQIDFHVDTINCLQDSATLIINRNSKYKNLFISGTDGFLQQDSFTYKFFKAGKYKFSLESNNFCQDSLEVDIVRDTDKPVLSSKDDTLNCLRRLTTLAGQTNDPGAVLNWKDPSGNRYQQKDLTVDYGGDFIFSAVSKNGCADSILIKVTVDTIAPKLNIATDTLNCLHPDFIVKHNGDSSSIIFDWTGPGGFNSKETFPSISRSGNYKLKISAANFCESIIDFAVTEDFNRPQLSGRDDVLNCLLDSIKLFANAVNHDGTLEWKLNNNYFSDVLNPFVKNPGDYLLIAHNRNGCKDSLILKIIADRDKPDLTVLGDTLDCAVKNITLTALSSKDSLNYLWSGPGTFNSTQKDVSISSGGVYKIKVTNPRGCTSELDYAVVQDTALPRFVLKGDSLNCKKTQIDLSYISATQNPRISWIGPGSFNSNQNTVKVNRGGYYILNLQTANNCAYTDSIFVFQDTVKPNLIVAGDTINCNKRIITLKAQTASASSLIEWTAPSGQKQTIRDLSTAEGGRFSVRVTAANFCTQDAILDVPVDTMKPVIQIANDTISCLNLQADLLVKLQNLQDKVRWTGPGGFTSNLPLEKTSVPGLYQLIVTSGNGCATLGLLNIFADTTRPQITANADSINCKNLESTLNVFGDLSGNRISWTDAQGKNISNQAVHKVSTAGIYQVSVENPVNGCKTVKPVQVIEDANLIKDVNLKTVSPICGDLFGSISILSLVGGHGNYKYSLDQGLTFSSKPDFSKLSPGFYDLLVVDDAGCEFIKNFEIIQTPFIITDLPPELQLDLGSEEQLLLTINIDPSKIKSVEWSPVAGLSCSDCLNPVAKPLVNTDYTVKVIDENGCESISLIKVKVKTPDVYVPNVFAPNGDNIHDRVFVYGPDNEVIKINVFQIFDRWGEKVFEIKNTFPNLPDHGWDGNFKGQKCNPGVYVYWVEVEALNGKKWSLKGDVTLLR
ncbi:MAG: gliding motility-associated C-terminal domain-containing protein [Saprospiraceae bacterium]|nr:gliding motility-associated C-terminal domain-containing protein [Candidatus Vicinibacter affinis]